MKRASERVSILGLLLLFCSMTLALCMCFNQFARGDDGACAQDDCFPPTYYEPNESNCTNPVYNADLDITQCDTTCTNGPVWGEWEPGECILSALMPNQNCSLIEITDVVWSYDSTCRIMNGNQTSCTCDLVDTDDEEVVGVSECTLTECQ